MKSVLLFALTTALACAQATINGTPNQSVTGADASKVNGATVPSSQPCLGSNSSSQLVAGSCSGGGAGANGGLTKFTISTSCGSTPNCYTVKADVQTAQSASWSSGGTTITTSSNDPPFTSADVGKIEFGTSNCGTNNGYIDCYTYVPQGTIVSYIDAHHVTVSNAATAASTGSSSWFAWGTQDDASVYQTAFAALLNAGGGSLSLPCNTSYVASAPFIVNVPHPYPIEIYGCGQATTLIPLPSFSQSSCKAYGNSTTWVGCIFSDWETFRVASQGALVQTPTTFDQLSNFRVWGLGQDGSSATARYSAIVGIGLTINNVLVVGWLWNQPYNSSTIDYCTYVVSSGTLNNTYSWSANTCGVAVQGDSVIASQTVINGGAYGPSGNGSGMVIPGISLSSINNGTHVTSTGSHFICYNFCNGSNNVTGVYIPTGATTPFFGGAAQPQWRSYGDSISGYTAGQGLVFIDGSVPFVGGNNMVMLSGSTAYLHNNVFTQMYNYSGSSIFDQGGNVWGSNITQGSTVYGSLSATGTNSTSSNISLSSGWGGSANVSSVSGGVQNIQFTANANGTTSANPTFTFTWPTVAGYFLNAPQCSAKQVGGTGATFAVNTGSPSTTNSGAFTVVGTPASGATYTFQVNCSVPL